jgi:predicted small lipoprotein YifL
MKTILIALAFLALSLTACEKKDPIDWENMDWGLKQRDEVYEHNTK